MAIKRRQHYPYLYALLRDLHFFRTRMTRDVIGSLYALFFYCFTVHTYMTLYTCLLQQEHCDKFIDKS